MIEWINEALAVLVASINVDNPTGLAMIFLLTAAADIGFPFPFVLDVLLFFTVYKEGPFSLPVFLIIIMLFGGRMLGTGILYWLSRSVRTKFIAWISKLPRFPGGNLDQIQNKLGRWTILAIAVARLTPGLMQVSSLTAGSLRIPYFHLVLAIALSSIVYDGALIILGSLTQIGFKGLDPKHSLWIVIGFVILLGLVSISIHFIRRKFKWN